MAETSTTLWADIIPDRIVIPGKSESMPEPVGQDLILERVPDVKYALYKIDYDRSRLFPENGSKKG